VITVAVALDRETTTFVPLDHQIDPMIAGANLGKHPITSPNQFIEHGPLEGGFEDIPTGCIRKTGERRAKVIEETSPEIHPAEIVSGEAVIEVEPIAGTRDGDIDPTDVIDLVFGHDPSALRVVHG